MKTMEEVNALLKYCKDLFLAKNRDYGTAWRILRPSSLTDQIFIKARRIRQIQDSGTQLVEDDISLDFVGIINYSIMALIQLDKGYADMDKLDLDTEVLEHAYNKQTKEVLTLLEAKNHDYGEAWRDLRVTSITDLILMKLLRLKSIEENQGITEVSEGLEANYQDLINYSLFALIHLGFGLKDHQAKN
jgi:hypothetical protein